METYTRNVVGKYIFEVNGSLVREDEEGHRIDIPLFSGRKAPQYDRNLALARSAEDVSVNPEDIADWMATCRDDCAYQDR